MERKAKHRVAFAATSCVTGGVLTEYDDRNYWHCSIPREWKRRTVSFGLWGPSNGQQQLHEKGRNPGFRPFESRNGCGGQKPNWMFSLFPGLDEGKAQKTGEPYGKRSRTD